MSENQGNEFEYLEYGPENNIRKLVFTFHGYGRNGWFLDKLNKDIAGAFPNTKVLALHGPDRLKLPKRLDISQLNFPAELKRDDGMMEPEMQRQWFSMQGGFPNIWWRLWKLIPRINKFADQKRDYYGLESRDIVYFGFSQGGAVASYAALRRKEAIACLVGHSTVFWGAMPFRSKIPVLFMYGDQDPSISQALYDKSIVKLQKHARPLDVIELADQGHYISSESRGQALAYLEKYLV